MCQFFPGKNMKQIAYRYKKLTKGKIKKYWSREEDLRLVDLIENYGENFEKLTSYFQDKSSNDIEARYYKKIKHLKLGFSAEEDEILLKLYRTRQISYDEMHALRGKGHIEINRRIEYLLSSNGEQMNKSFNASSILSSSCSSTANLDNNWKMDVDDEGIQPQIYNHDLNYSWYHGKANNNFSNSNTRQTSQANTNFPTNYKTNTFQSKQQSVENFFGSSDLDCNFFYSDLSKDSAKGNSNWQNKLKDADLSDTFTFTPDLNESCIQRLNEPDDSFEASFYSAFKFHGNDNFLDLDEDDDMDKALNQASSSAALANYISKKRSLEQILNKIHGISRTCYVEIESKAKLNLSPENLLVFNDLSQKLQNQENDYKNQLDYERQDLALKKINIAQSGDQDLMKSLGRQIEFLIKLIHIYKMKLKLFKRATQSHT